MNPTAKELKTAIAWHSGFGYTYTPIFIQLDGLIYNLDLDQYSLKWTWAHLRLCLQDMRFHPLLHCPLLNYISTFSSSVPQESSRAQHKPDLFVQMGSFPYLKSLWIL
ncbi:uncharacterized protein LOC111450724 isoform X1 [Cucurbita moschata]|uniref:Uncharacterized protein LOC111450724 isoform X1 n=1 Tax=Cucurbita moschata TaxID=3662 RepID=A0A6J1G4R9_CUCMO|nr:uncharacterized protein LOC111450724 isoform X1 [Cucurbita moschata]